MFPSPSGPPPATGYKTFDIAVSPDLPSQVESPLKAYPLPDRAPVKARIQPFIPVIIGVAVILLFIVGTLVVSGNWNPLGTGNTTNSTTGVVN